MNAAQLGYLEEEVRPYFHFTLITTIGAASAAVLSWLTDRLSLALMGAIVAFWILTPVGRMWSYPPGDLRAPAWKKYVSIIGILAVCTFVYRAVLKIL
ncbi:MAG: hypothetical protein JO145_07415 [Acidobacteriaceae bacterium]|nr:hypothetical protein [Acidobacteriaceae bacterium]MBV9753101.1 hypothetical protein [Hyphomicrobiales bacterium]